MTAAQGREKPREETEARLLRERGTPEERIGPVVPDGTLYPQSESAANTEQLELVPVPRCNFCGPLQHTIDRWGRETHKCKCPYRTDDFCEAHPTGDCEPPKPRWNPKWPLESLYGETWEDAFGYSSDAVDESAGLKETA